MIVLVIVVIVMPMTVIVMMIVAAMRRFIGATFRLKWRVNDDKPGAQAFEHLLNRRVASHPQPALQHLNRDMTVTKMPGQSRQSGQIGGARFDQRLGLGDDFDDTAVLKHKGIIGAQPHRLGKIHLDAGSPDAEQETLLHLTLRERKDQCVDDIAGFSISRWLDARGAWHRG
jgi:hypothetical protein